MGKASPFVISFLSTTALVFGCSGSTPNASIDDDSGGTHGDSAGSETSITDDSAVVVTDSNDDTTTTDTTGARDTPSTGAHVKTVFVIVMENHDWSAIKASASAPYINGLLSKASYASNYNTPAGNHPSEPNYIWLEAGSNLGITTDDDPSPTHHLTETDHLVSQLAKAGLTWKSYVEDIDGSSCPLASSGKYAAKHVPQIFFDDVATPSKNCTDHIRPYSELSTDLSGGTGLARYDFITPNLCNDMHGNLAFSGGCLPDVATGDTWLSKEVPKILDSAAYKDNGALFILWDEGTAPILGTSSDGPIGLIVLSPLAKGAGYTNSTKYTHSSTLKTFERIFGVPFLRDAAAAGTTDLADLFMAGALP